MNKLIITGRLTRDAEFRKSADSTVINFIIANNDSSYKDSKTEKWIDKPVYIHCTLWSRSVTQIDFFEKWLKKGQSLLVQGSVDLQVYLSKEKTAAGKIILNVDSLERFD